MLALWGVCGNAKCRRARACRGDVCACVARKALLVPEGAREGVKAMIEGRQDGAKFDAVQDRAYDDVEALLNWRETVERAIGASKPLARKLLARTRNAPTSAA